MGTICQSLKAITTQFFSFGAKFRNTHARTRKEVTSNEQHHSMCCITLNLQVFLFIFHC